MIDLGTGNNNKMYGFFVSFFICLLLTKSRRDGISNWAMDSKQEVRDSHIKLSMDKFL